MDRVSGEVQALIDQCPQLRDDGYYNMCIRSQLAAHYLRRDATQFVKALAMFNQINLKAAVLDNGAIATEYIGHAFLCFSMLLVDEAFQLISKVNSTEITSHQLTTVKSLTRTFQYEDIMKYGLMSDELGRLKLLGKFYQKMKLNLPTSMKALKTKIKELLRVMHIDLLRKVMEVDGMGKGWEGERDEVRRTKELIEKNSSSLKGQMEKRLRCLNKLHGFGR